MIPIIVKHKVFSLRTSHWDRELFDELVPLPDGTSYNAYLVQGSEKTALIDTTYPPKTAELINALRAMKLERLDYVVANHGEEDHSGSIPAVLALFPDAKVVTNATCERLLKDALELDDSVFIEVKDGETLSLGDKTLQFLLTPWVHWPDTMLTHLVEDGIVFTCDFLGAHLATSELFATDEARLEVAAKRYYAEIMMPYRAHSKKALDRLTLLKPKMIAPSHGPVHARPAFIMDLYREWVSDSVKPEVLIPYVSMYTSTSSMVEYLVDRLTERKLGVRPFNVVNGDSGDLAMALVDASSVVFASPLVLAGPHPALAHAVLLANALAPKTKFASVVGSAGWGGNLPDIIRGMLPRLKATFLPPVMTKGRPKPETFAELDRLANDLAEANFSGKLPAASSVEPA